MSAARHRQLRQNLAPRGGVHRLPWQHAPHGRRGAYRSLHPSVQMLQVEVFLTRRETGRRLCGAHASNFIIGKEFQNAVARDVGSSAAAFTASAALSTACFTWSALSSIFDI